MGEVDLERSPDGGWSCLELVGVRAVKELCGLVWSHEMMVHVVVQGVQSPSPRVHFHKLIGALSRRPRPVPLSTDDRELAELRLRYDNDNLRDCRRDFGRLSSTCIAVVAVETEDSLRSRSV